MSTADLEIRPGVDGFAPPAGGLGMMAEPPAVDARDFWAGIEAAESAPPPAPKASPPPAPKIAPAPVLAGIVKPKPRLPLLDGQPAATKAGPPLVDAADFCRDFPDVDYVVEDVIQRGYLYSCTALTGHGKTAILTRTAISIAIEKVLGPYPVQQGRVLYLAGENPDDFRARMAGTAQEMGASPESLRDMFYVVPAAFPLVSMLPELRAIAERIGPLALIVIDTSAAFFSYGDENDNVDARNHAADCRSLTTVKGNPAVIVACHPTKSASKDNLLPRGGGGFLNEVDGNLTVWRDGEVVTLHHHGKLRGAPFDPIQFKLLPIELNGIKRRNGKPVRSVTVQWIDDAAAATLDRGRAQDEDRLLYALLHHPNESQAGWASICGWRSKATVHAVLQRLAADKLVTKYRSRYKLTEAGEREARKIK